MNQKPQIHTHSVIWPHMWPTHHMHNTVQGLGMCSELRKRTYSQVKAHEEDAWQWIFIARESTANPLACLAQVINNIKQMIEGGLRLRLTQSRVWWRGNPTVEQVRERLCTERYKLAAAFSWYRVPAGTCGWHSAVTQWCSCCCCSKSQEEGEIYGCHLFSVVA